MVFEAVLRKDRLGDLDDQLGRDDVRGCDAQPAAQLARNVHDEKRIVFQIPAVEKVFDVVWSGDRQPGPDGKLPAVGNTVDVANATWTNTIGEPELIAVWRDPDFDPATSAFYYARVLEIPTPTWQAFDANFFGITMPDQVSMSHQDRAYTSPIWYTP